MKLMSAIMSKILAVILLLIILVGSFSDGTATSAGFQFRVSKMHIQRCRCAVFPGGKIKCRFPLVPTNSKEKMDLIKCLCNKPNQHKFPEFQSVCKSYNPTLPLSFI